MKHQTEHQIEFAITLSYCHARPFDVEKLVAGWVRGSSEQMASGFVVLLNSGRYAYITSSRSIPKVPVDDGAKIVAQTEFFGQEPKHLYDRAADWVFDEEVLNGTITRAKSEARYPADSRSADSAVPRPMVRVPTG